MLLTTITTTHNQRSIDGEKIVKGVYNVFFSVGVLFVRAKSFSTLKISLHQQKYLLHLTPKEREK